MKLKTAFKIIIIAAILLPALVVGAYGSYSYLGFYTKMVSEETASAAYSEAKSQALFFERYAAQLSVMAQLEQIKRAAVGDYAAIKDQVDAVLSSGIDAAIKDIIVMDGGGLVVANTQTDLNLLQKVFEGYDDPITSLTADGFYVSPVSANNEKYGASIIYVVKPVVTVTDSTGYIAAAVDIGTLNTALSGASFFGSAGSIMFVDGAGTGLNVNGSIAASPRTFTTDMLSPINDITRYVTTTEDGYYVTYGVIDNTDWVWVGTCSVSSVTFSMFPPILFGLIVIAVCIVINVLLAFGIYRRAITPIGQIIGAMEQINAGDRQKRLPSFKTYEYQIISNTFNDLLDDFYISEDVHRTVSSLSDSVLFEWDLENKRMYVSDNFKDMFDIDVDKTGLMDGTFIDTLMSDKDARHFRKDMNSLIEEREYAEGEYQVRTVRNTEIWINIKAQSYAGRKGNGNVTRILGVITDINNKKKTSLQLSQKASYDFLSQLYNRSTFLKELQKLLDMKRVNENYAVLFIDVDDFKFINDRYGHNVGDEVIKYVADTLKKCISGNGIAGRFGGDEFVLCLTNSNAVANCDDFAANLIDSLYSGYRCDSIGITLNVKASIGITIVSEQVSDAEKLIGEADEAMYFVKKHGKSNFHFFDPEAAPNLDLGNAIT